MIRRVDAGDLTEALVALIPAGVLWLTLHSRPPRHERCVCGHTQERHRRGRRCTVLLGRRLHDGRLADDWCQCLTYRRRTARPGRWM